ncbi:MAG: glycosyltransferase family 39 protein [Thermoanaerobaculia bacterium]|nr:glycosyltransferase family 39 protein [Thermoanaerobaculia bacterium]
MSDVIDPRTRRRDLLLLALAAALLVLPGIGSRDLWNPDEPRYAEVAREMLESGQWFVPHLNGEIYSHKPPLLMWLMAASSFVTGGMNEVAARLPSALALIAATLATYLLGLSLLGSRRGALVAAAILATSGRLLWQARVGQIDMLLLALVAFAVWFWVRGFQEGRPGFYRLFFLFAGFATLAKGPVGLLPPLFSILVFLWLTGRKSEIRAMRIPTGLLLWALPVLLWLVPAGFQGGTEYLHDIVFRQNVTRYADPWHHFQPFYYYLGTVPGDFFPWSLLLPGAILLGRKHLTGLARQGWLFGLVWAAVTIVFFSLSPAKRTVYPLSMFPGLALAVAAVIDHLASQARRTKWLTVPFAAVGAIGLLAVAALPRVAEKQAEVLAILGDGFLGLVRVLPVLLAVAGIAAAVWSHRGRPLHAALTMAAGLALMGLWAFTVVVPRFNVLKTARPLAAELVARMAPGEAYTIYPRFDAPFVFYSRRWAEVVAGEEELQAFARRPGRVWVLAERDDLAKLSAPLPLVEVARGPEPKQGYVLLTTPP